MGWRTAVGKLTGSGVNEVIKRQLLELAMADEMRDCVGALQKEH